MEKQYYVYIMSNKASTVTYVGVTNDLLRRVYEHKNKTVKGFTSKYNIDKLIYYEISQNIESAILREKQIKGGSRRDKVALIKSINTNWQDLYDQLLEGTKSHCETIPPKVGGEAISNSGQKIASSLHSSQ